MTTIPEVTRGAILREFRRLCDLVDQAERHEYVSVTGERAIGLLAMDDAIRMRDTYRERADAVLKTATEGEVIRHGNERDCSDR